MLVTNRPNRASELLELWEKVVTLHPWERGDAMLSACHAEPATLSARNAALLSLRAQLFGTLQPLRCTCTECGADVEFQVDCDVLASELAQFEDRSRSRSITADGFQIEFRVPTPTMLRLAAARAHDRKSFVHELLDHCITVCKRADETICTVAALSATAAQELSDAMEATDPGAAVSFELSCPECGGRWRSIMDCGEVLWTEVQSRAERLLLDVDVIARAYGWHENEILALSPTRRAAYLQLVGAA